MTPGPRIPTPDRQSSPVNVRENKRHCRRADKPPIREVCWSKPTEPSQNFNMASFFHVMPFSTCSSLDLANVHPGQMDHLSFSVFFSLPALTRVTFEERRVLEAGVVFHGCWRHYDR